jgi:hypothetical protein
VSHFVTRTGTGVTQVGRQTKGLCTPVPSTRLLVQQVASVAQLPSVLLPVNGAWEMLVPSLQQKCLSRLPMSTSPYLPRYPMKKCGFRILRRRASTLFYQPASRLLGPNGAICIRSSAVLCASMLFSCFEMGMRMPLSSTSPQSRQG